MVESKDFEIQFSALKLGSHQFNFDIEDSFFTLFDYSEIEKANISISVAIVKKTTLLQLDFAITGYLTLACDRCSEDYQQEINQHFELIVKFSDIVESVECDEILILSSNEHTLSLARYIYEFVHLSLPSKRTHQSLDECNPKMLEHIEQMGLTEDIYETIDPRWENLKQLKTK
jgi:uncharacterized metal-binding protein YceD (DUF177 family)